MIYTKMKNSNSMYNLFPNKKSLSLYLLLCIFIINLLIPQGLFDSHIGVENDIYCKCYYSLYSYYNFPLKIIAEYFEYKVNCFYCTIYKATVSLNIFPIRAPPRFLIVTV